MARASIAQAIILSVAEAWSSGSYDKRGYSLKRGDPGLVCVKRGPVIIIHHNAMRAVFNDNRGIS